jgi:hypothetical protein
MKLVNNSAGFVTINETLINRGSIQKIAIENEPESEGGKPRLVVSTGLISCYIYGKKEIRNFLAENYRKGTINEIGLR